MKFVGLNDREYSIQLTDYLVLKDDKRKRSAPHMRARTVIDQVFPNYSVYEEVRVKNTGGKFSLYLDFFIPNLDLVIEVHGEQHYTYSEHFHGTYAKFLKHQHRDDLKKEWCELNGLTLVELNHGQSDEVWVEQLRST